MNHPRGVPARTTTAALMAVLALMFGAGCGSGTQDTSAADTKPTKAATPTATTADPTDSGEPSTDADSAEALRAFIQVARPIAEREVKRYADVYSDFSLESEGSNTLVYRYTFRNHVDPAEAKAQLESGSEALRVTAEQSIFPEMEAAGIEAPAAKWVYLNSDGSAISSFKFES